MPDFKHLGKDDKRDLTKSLVKADKMLQIAFALPAAVFIGWLIGAGLDRWLHQHWIYLVGIFFGIGAGFVQIFRMLHELEGEIDGGKAGKSAPEDENADKKAAEDDKIWKEPK